MTKVSLRNVGAHKLRLALTVLAVVLGTAFLSGAMMFTNMLEKTFDSAVDNAFQGVDAVVSPKEGQISVPFEVGEELKNDPKVANVNVIATATVVAAKDSGSEDPEPFQTGGGGSQVGVYYPDDQSVREPMPIEEGQAPSKPQDVVVNASAAEKYEISVGDKLTVVDTQDRREYVVSGIYKEELDTGNAINLLIDEKTYLEFYAPPEGYPDLALSAAEGTEAPELVSDLKAKYPDYEVEEGQKLSEEISKQIRDALSFVSYFLIAFGLIGLLVGTFLIANTFSMIVAQRTKEFALLRALGASGGQVMRSVIVEAFIVGLIGSIVGVLAGTGIVAGIRALMNSQGVPLPGGGSGLSWDAVLIPIIVGVVVTIFSAWAPARRAGKVQPVEAMRSGETAMPQPLKVRTIIGAVLLALAAGLVAWGVLWEDGSTGNRATLIGIATVSVIVGLFLAGPALSLPVVPGLGRAIGAPFGSVGKLAATNSKRNPRRVAATAFALMLGIALVTAIGMFGASWSKSLDKIMDDELKADYVLSGPDGGAFPVPSELPKKLHDVDGVGDVMLEAYVPMTIDGEYGQQFGGQGSTAVASGDLSKLAEMEIVEGSVDLSEGGVIVDKPTADKRGWKVGDEVELAAPQVSPNTKKTKVIGIFSGSTVITGYRVSDKDALEVVPEQMFMIQMVGVTGDGSMDNAQLRSNLEEAVKPLIVVQVYTPDELGGEWKKMMNQILSILYALLSLAVIIAILGIINTLTLSVIERRQEIGMLRAVGTGKGQIRTMITLESVQIAIFGALLGVATGLILGWGFLSVLAGVGMEEVVVPWSLLGIMAAGAVLVGLIAAIWPAIRAAGTPPLDAIVDE